AARLPEPGHDDFVALKDGTRALVLTTVAVGLESEYDFAERRSGSGSGEGRVERPIGKQAQCREILRRMCWIGGARSACQHDVLILLDEDRSADVCDARIGRCERERLLAERRIERSIRQQARHGSPARAHIVKLALASDENL